LTPIDAQAPARRIVRMGFAALAGLIPLAIAAAAEDLPRRDFLFATLGAAFLLGIIWTRRIKEACLIGLVLSLTYNRAYFSFDDLVGDYASNGLYWIVADIFMMLMLMQWGYQGAVKKQHPSALGRPVWPILLPFVGACLLSLLAAKSVPPGIFELWRLAKAAFLYTWIRHNVKSEEWWWGIGALGIAVLFQSAWGLGQTVFGFESVFRPEGAIAAAAAEVKNTVDSSRASGTLDHPQIFCSYFLLVVPVFLSMLIAASSQWLRLVMAGLSLLGLASIAATQARVGWVICALILVVLFVGLVVLRFLSVTRLIALTSVAVLVLGAALIPLRDKIAARISGDFSANLSIRTRYNNLALDLASHSPWIGVGLNNFAVDDPDINDELANLETTRKPLHLRVSAPVHNVYLLFLAEAGVLGLSTFLIFALGSLVLGIAAVRATTGLRRAACWGLTVGMAGVLIHQLTEFTFWVDPILYTYFLVLALLSVAPALERPQLEEAP
jgi:putative inorganic carbon (HCO3(-)) transporter